LEQNKRFCLTVLNLFSHLSHIFVTGSNATLLISGDTYGAGAVIRCLWTTGDGWAGGGPSPPNNAL